MCLELILYFYNQNIFETTELSSDIEIPDLLLKHNTVVNTCLGMKFSYCCTI